jgi:hypothetical protein
MFVTITPKLVVDPKHPVRNVDDFESDSHFESKNEPDQWVYSDFREMRVRPTHYTLRTVDRKSWVVEGSLGGNSWTEIDRQTDNRDFGGGVNPASFSVSNPAELPPVSSD